jgi:hypothetical protein
MRTVRAILTVSAALAAGFAMGTQTSNPPSDGYRGAQGTFAKRPEHLPEVRPGMHRDIVLAGLSECCNLSKTSPDGLKKETWSVISKDVTEHSTDVGHITFSNEVVTDVTEFLTQTYNPDTAGFVQDLFADLEVHARPDPVTDPITITRRTSAANFLWKETVGNKDQTTDNTQVISIQLKDVTYQISVADSPFAPSPNVQIMRVRSGSAESHRK